MKKTFSISSRIGLRYFNNLSNYTKAFILMSFCLITTPKINSQSETTETVKSKPEKKNLFFETDDIYGIIVGGTLSKISNYGGDSRLGLTFGLYWETKISNKFSIMSNILYSERGSKGNDKTSDIKLTYINFPTMVKYRLSENIAVSTGINFDYKIDSKTSTKTEFEEFDWGIPFGVSFKISNNLLLNGVYSFGMRDITENDNLSLKNNWGSISISYLFQKKNTK